MTDKEWETRTQHAQGMLWVLRSAQSVARTKIGRRRLRLFACACCRLVWDCLDDRRHRDAVDIAERFADGLATKSELESAHSAVRDLSLGGFLPDDEGVKTRTARSMARATTFAQPFDAAFDMTAMPVPLAGYQADGKGGEEVLCDLIRHVFGNPFHAGAAPSFSSSSVVKLAEAMYAGEDCSFALHDALLEAGHPELAEHFTEKEHPKGCWVLDTILISRKSKNAP